LTDQPYLLIVRETETCLCITPLVVSYGRKIYLHRLYPQRTPASYLGLGLCLHAFRFSPLADERGVCRWAVRSLENVCHT